MDSKLNENTRNRLAELESELESSRAKQAELKARWENEKLLIKHSRDLKAEIEKVKGEADIYEREGNLEKVAELRYGRLHELNQKLEKANKRLEDYDKGKSLLKEIVDEEDIAEIVAKWTGIPVSKMLESERIKLVRMEDRIHRRLINQREAVTSIANAIRRSRSGLQDANRPIGSFVFLGTTGVGKTELARALAEFLFDDEQAIIRIDMSEYMEKFSVSRLIGAPPGYVGYEEGGQLTEAIRVKPYSVVLLDEIEKAHPDVFNILLQVLDEGHLTDGKGRRVNFKNSIIIMTSNIGTTLIQDKMTDITERNRDEIMNSLRVPIIDMMRQTMKPEFLNRIDEIVIFKPLLGKEIRQIAVLQIQLLKNKLEKMGITLEVSDEALDWIANLGFDVKFGARPLKRVIQRHISDPLSMKLLESGVIAGQKVIVGTTGDGEFTFNIENLS